MNAAVRVITGNREKLSNDFDLSFNMRFHVILFICALIIVKPAIETYAQADPAVWITNNDVEQMTRGDGKIFMCGDFNWWGTKHPSSGVVFDGNLELDGSYPDIEAVH